MTDQIEVVSDPKLLAAVDIVADLLRLEQIDDFESSGRCPVCNHADALTLIEDEDGVREVSCARGCAEGAIRQAILDRAAFVRGAAAALPPVTARARPKINGAHAFDAEPDAVGPGGPEPPAHPGLDGADEADRHTRLGGSEELAPLETIDPLAWAGAVVPERRWLVPDLLPESNVTLLAGDGATGKSTLALQLAVACALGKNWIGRTVRRCKALVVACEDDADELHRRLAAVVDHYGASFADLEDLAIVCRVGLDSVLLDFPDPWRPGRTTDFYRQVERAIGDYGPELLVLDSLHDLFGANENVRPHARQFVGALRALAIRMRGAVVVTAHPSLSGRNSGSGESGSTAWSNAVRSRLYLTKPGTGDEVDDLARDRRELRSKKSNYGPGDDVIALRWKAGVFVAEEQGAAGGVVDALTVERDVLEAARTLVASGTMIPASQNARTGLANAVRRLPACRRYSWAAIVAAQARLTQAGRLVQVEQGPPSRRHVYVRPSDTTLPGETKAAD